VTRTRAGILTLARVRSFVSTSSVAIRSTRSARTLDTTRARHAARSTERAHDTSAGDVRRPIAASAVLVERAERAFQAALTRLRASEVSRTAAGF
jgi:hypothetical protein